MTIEYDTDMNDIEAWHRYFVKLPQVAPALHLQSLATALASGAIVGALTLTTSKNVWAGVIAGGTIFLVVWPLMAVAVRVDTLRRARRAVVADTTSPALGHHTLRVAPDGVTETSSHHTLSVRWDAVARTDRTKDHYFILLRSLSAMIIPFRTFSSDAEKEGFVHLVEQLFSSHGASGTTAPSNQAMERTNGK